MADVEEVLRRCKEELIFSIYANTYPYHYYYFDNTTYTAINNTTTTSHSYLPTQHSYHYPPNATTITTTTTEDSGAVFGGEVLHPSLTTSTEWDLNWTSTEQTTDDNYYYHHQLHLHYQNIIAELRLCRDCNFTSEEVSILFASGTCSPSDYSYMPLIYVMYGVILLAALLGNSLVLHTVTANRKMHTVTNLFIANLAVGDLLIMVFCVPFSVASIMVLQYWPFGAALCVFVNYSQVSE